MLIITNFSGGTKAENSCHWLSILHGERGGGNRLRGGGEVRARERNCFIMYSSQVCGNIYTREEEFKPLAKEEAHEIMVYSLIF